MAKDLKGYDGSFDGVKILHGVAVISQGRCAPLDRPSSPVSPVTERLPSAGDFDIEPVVARAIEVIGSREEALRWLGTPIRALDYATPISRLNDSASQEEVLAVLTQLEHGVL